MAGAQDPHAAATPSTLAAATRSLLQPVTVLDHLGRKYPGPCFTLTHRVFLLVPRDTEDCLCPGPLHMLSSLPGILFFLT